MIMKPALCLKMDSAESMSDRLRTMIALSDEFDAVVKYLILLFDQSNCRADLALGRINNGR